MDQSMPLASRFSGLPAIDSILSRILLIKRCESWFFRVADGNQYLEEIVFVVLWMQKGCK